MLRKFSLSGIQHLRILEPEFWRIFQEGNCPKHPFCMERRNACGRQADFNGYHARSVAWFLKFGAWAFRLNSRCHNIACVHPGHLSSIERIEVPVLQVESASHRLSSILSD